MSINCRLDVLLAITASHPTQHGPHQSWRFAPKDERLRDNGRCCMDHWFW